jgi:hypothetical protein
LELVVLSNDSSDITATEALSLRFAVEYDAPFGSKLGVIGSLPQLGTWQQPVPMVLEQGVWRATVALPLGAHFEWKFGSPASVYSPP